jgi:hypothetical protein
VSIKAGLDAADLEPIGTLSAAFTEC